MEDQFLTSIIEDSHGQHFTENEEELYVNKTEDESNEIKVHFDQYSNASTEYYKNRFFHEHDNVALYDKDDTSQIEYDQQKEEIDSRNSEEDGDEEDNLKEKIIKNISRLIESISFYSGEETEENENDHVTCDVNNRYIRTRRSNTAGKYRVGPSPLSKTNISTIHDNKPGLIKLYVGNTQQDNSKSALLAYLSAFTEQIYKTEIDLNFVQTLLKFGIDINEYDDAGQTALYAFVRDWHPDVVRFALENKADVNVQDEFGRSPLHLVAALNNADIAQILIDAGADTNLETFHERQTPVHFASKYNSLDVLKVLIRHGGSVIKRDHKNRAVLPLAAEWGSELTTEFLLEMGIPVGGSDIYGHSTLSYIIEKIPRLASKALEQYDEKSMKQNTSKLYLNALEPNYTNSYDSSEENSYHLPLVKYPLEIITIYKDVELIMHPVIQATLAVKWKLFGYKDAVIQLILSVINFALWILLLFVVELNHHNYKTNLLRWQGWIITLEVLLVLLSVHFFVRDFRLFKRAVNDHQEWIDTKRAQVQGKFIHCHPCWPSERELVFTEYEAVPLVPSLSRGLLFWFIYEWINMIFLSSCIITRVLTIFRVDTVSLFIAAKLVRSLNLGYASLRIIKVLVRFKFTSLFLKVASRAGTSFIQIVFLYAQFYIPFVALFWLWFGDDHKIMQITRHRNNNAKPPPPSNHTLDHRNIQESLYVMHELFFLVFTSSFTKESLLPLKQLDQIAFICFMSLFHLFTTVVALSIVIAFIRAKFTIAIRHCESEASLSQSTLLLLLEKGLKRKDKLHVDYYYRTRCAPQVIINPPGRKEGSDHHAFLKLKKLQSYLYKVEEHLKHFEIKFHNLTQSNKMCGTGRMYNQTLNNVRTFLEKCSVYDERLEREFKYLKSQNEIASLFLPRLLNDKSTDGKNAMDEKSEYGEE